MEAGSYARIAPQWARRAPWRQTILAFARKHFL
jgi:hypothetical protein